MSRSGYTDEYCEDQWALIRWRGAVKAAINGRRGQTLLRELAQAMDAMSVKKLVANELQADGQFCALGMVGSARGLDLSKLDPEDLSGVAGVFGIAEALAAEVMWVNDEHVDEHRWIDVEICGPMRPHYPDWNQHTRTIMVPNEQAAAERFRTVREWVRTHMMENANV